MMRGDVMLRAAWICMMTCMMRAQRCCTSSHPRPYLNPKGTAIYISCKKVTTHAVMAIMLYGIPMHWEW
jgi:hypothetical protein